jgi:hypothetical protein
VSLEMQLRFNSPVVTDHFRLRHVFRVLALTAEFRTVRSCEVVQRHGDRDLRYFFTPKFPRSVFTNRKSLPFVLISRSKAE